MILAAFEMEEILYELRDHSAGLNAGRWDYLLGDQEVQEPRRLRAAGPGAGHDDRPFMRAYTGSSSRSATSAARTRSAGWRRSSRAAGTPR